MKLRVTATFCLWILCTSVAILSVGAQDCTFDRDLPKGPASVVSMHTIQGDESYAAHDLQSDGRWYPVMVRNMGRGTRGVVVSEVRPPYHAANWSRAVRHPVAQTLIPVSVGVDEEGSVYMLGRSLFANHDSDPLLMKMSAEGDSLWAVDYRPSAHETFSPRSLHLGPNAEITVIGGEGLASRPAVLRFDSQGRLVWNVRLARVGFATDIARGPAGEIFVASNVFFGNESRGSMLEISPNGEIVWEHEHAGSQGRSDANVVQVHPHGGVVVGGVQRGGDYLDFLAYRLDAHGDLMWEHVYDRGGDDFLVDLVVAPDGDVLLFGHSSAGAGYDWAVQRISPDGELRWSRFFDQAAGCARQLIALRIHHDGHGGAYVAGSISNTQNPDHEELAVARIRGDGAISWALQLPSSGYQRGIRDMSILRADDGHVLVAYNSSSAGHLVVIDDQYVGTSAEWNEPTQASLRAYPNPTSARLHVLLESADFARVDAIDATGRRVSSVPIIGRGEQEIVLDVSRLPSGFYFAVIEVNTGRRVVPFTVAR